jgi:selT/selW/selH-like putative selenoprotein
VLELEPSSGGCFEITVDDQPLYSKLATGQFPNEAEIVSALGQGRG